MSRASKGNPTISGVFQDKRYTPANDTSSINYIILDYEHPQTKKVFRLQRNHLVILKDMSAGKPLIIIGDFNQSDCEFHLVKNKSEKQSIRQCIVLELEANGLIRNSTNKFKLTPHGKELVDSQEFKSLLKNMTESKFFESTLNP